MTVEEKNYIDTFEKESLDRFRKNNKNDSYFKNMILAIIEDRRHILIEKKFPFNTVTTAGNDKGLDAFKMYGLQLDGNNFRLISFIKEEIGIIYNIDLNRTKPYSNLPYLIKIEKNEN